MKGKRGFVFGLYLVLLTILMMGVVITLYLTQQKNVNGLLVSPVEVLEVRDNLEIFEMKENEISKEVFDSVKASGKAIGSDEFRNEFRKDFLDKVFSNGEMKEFLFDNLTIDSKEIDTSTLEYRNFLEKKVYKKEGFYFEGEILFIERSILGKKFKLRALDAKREIRFPVTFYFDFERKFKANREIEV